MERGKKRVVDSQLESVHLVRMNHLNSAGRLFGGQLMQWIDETAAMAAKRHAHRPIITASFNNLVSAGSLSGRYGRAQGKDCLCRTYIYGCQSGDLCRDGNRRTVSD